MSACPGHDVYLNVAGGLRITEPAADLAAAAALLSSLAHAPLPADAVYFGEVSLSGAVRPVGQTAARLKEAQKLGFTKAIAPEAARKEAAEGFTIIAHRKRIEPCCRYRARGIAASRPVRRTRALIATPSPSLSCEWSKAGCAQRLKGG